MSLIFARLRVSAQFLLAFANLAFYLGLYRLPRPYSRGNFCAKETVPPSFRYPFKSSLK